MCRRSIFTFVLRWNKFRTICRYDRCLNTAAFYHNAIGPGDELLPFEWYRMAYAKLIRLTRALSNVERIDGSVTNISDNRIVTDHLIISRMQEFKSIAREFIGSPLMQHALPLRKKCMKPCFIDRRERNSMTLDSLTKVCSILNISAQQRRDIRLTVCPQVTQHHIWLGALEEVLGNLKSDMDAFRCRSPNFQMGEQVLSSCIKFLTTDATSLPDSGPPSWMRPAPLRKIDVPLPPRKWEEVLEMFVHLSRCLSQEERLSCHISKLEAMKEGLYQIKDILVERDISYKEARRQDCLVQKKLTKSLGHSSKCLFTLLLYYLYGTVKDIEVDVYGVVSGSGDADGICLCVGKFLTSCDEGMVWNGVKELSRALGVFKLVWETAAMKGSLELQGHVWCLGAEERTLTYRGIVFFVHEIRI